MQSIWDLPYPHRACARLLRCEGICDLCMSDEMHPCIIANSCNVMLVDVALRWSDVFSLPLPSART